MSNPLDAAALLLTATARCDGDMSANQKQTILKLFEQQLHMSKKDAEGYLTSSVYLLREEFDIVSQIPKILRPSKDKFSKEQTDSLLKLMKEVAYADSAPRDTHDELINAVVSVLPTSTGETHTWQT